MKVNTKILCTIDKYHDSDITSVAAIDYEILQIQGLIRTHNGNNDLVDFYKMKVESLISSK